VIKEQLDLAIKGRNSIGGKEYLSKVN